MTKTELIAKVAQSAQMGKTEANQALNAVIDAVQEALAKEGKVILSGFGMFWTEKGTSIRGVILAPVKPSPCQPELP